MGSKYCRVQSLTAPNSCCRIQFFVFCFCFVQLRSSPEPTYLLPDNVTSAETRLLKTLWRCHRIQWQFISPPGFFFVTHSEGQSDQLFVSDFVVRSYSSVCFREEEHLTDPEHQSSPLNVDILDLSFFFWAGWRGGIKPRNKLSFEDYKADLLRSLPTRFPSAVPLQYVKSNTSRQHWCHHRQPTSASSLDIVSVGVEGKTQHTPRSLFKPLNLCYHHHPVTWTPDCFLLPLSLVWQRTNSHTSSLPASNFTFSPQRLHKAVPLLLLLISSSVSFLASLFLGFDR